VLGKRGGRADDDARAVARDGAVPARDDWRQRGVGRGAGRNVG
jgi:hypothetical protein